MPRLEDTLSIADLRAMSRARLPRMVFDYIDGGAEDEVTLRRSVDRFSDYELTWNALRDVSDIDLSATMMGEQAQLPFLIAPTAAARLFHPKAGELAAARAASRKAAIYCCSTLASQTVEDIAASASGPKWVQVYVWKDRGLVEDFLYRAKAAGFTGCVLTVDLAMGG
ncbi:MAG: alpha-hydroxy-acid oxidizing protein, partial [Pseudomonadota bacterium]